jgi:hypothetical protein
MRIVTIIDFEATALSIAADPIEVGVAIYDRDESVITTWSSLIRPNPSCMWDEKSAAIHQIARADLKDAPEPASVSWELNQRMIGIQTAYCDGYEFDTAWLARLYQGTDPPRFKIEPLEMMPRMHLRVVRHHMGDYLARTVVPHRAGADALRLMQAYVYALGRKVSVQAVS